MITKANYFEKVQGINLKTLPDSLKNEAVYIKEITKNYTTWKFYDTHIEIKSLVDEYLISLNEHLNQDKGKTSPTAEKARYYAKKLIWAYVQRGDSLESIKSGSMGAALTDYTANVKGAKIEVTEIKGHKVNFSFPLQSIYNEVKAELTPPAKPGKNENHQRKGLKKDKSNTQTKKAEPKPATTENSPYPELPAEKTFPKKDPQLVERISEEVKFIKRFVTMQGRIKTREQILSFLNALQRAILEKRIRKTSPFAQEIKYIQHALVKLHNHLLLPKNKNKTAKIRINDRVFKFLNNIASKERGMLSIAYLKRYIGIQGKHLTKEKVERLLQHLKNAAKSRKIISTDPYAAKLKTIFESLTKFLTSAKRNETLEVHPAVLNGINQTLEGCCCDEKKKDSELNGVVVEKPVPVKSTEKPAPAGPDAMTVDEARAMEFDPVETAEEWTRLIGRFCLPTHFLVYGLGGSGKTTFVLIFCQHLASIGYRIYYVAGEQYRTPAFTDLLNRLDIQAGPDFQIVGHMDELNPASFDFIVLDSKDKLDIEADDFEALTEQYPEQSFIVLSHATATGDFTGRKRWRNLVEVMVKAEGGLIQTGMDKNRWGGSSEMRVYEPKEQSKAA